MTYEFYYYIFLVIIGFLFCILKISSFNYYVISFMLFLILSIIVRFSGFDSDIANYVRYLSYDSLSFYYYKEPFYWLGSRYIYRFIGMPELVFIFYDILFVLILLYITKVQSLPKYFPYLLLLFFPILMGMQNVYRQFIACGFLLLFLSSILNSSSFSIRFVSLLLAGLSHNAAFLFAPMIFLDFQSKDLSKKFLISSVSVLIVLPFLAFSKSNSETGDLPSHIYIIFVFLIFLFHNLLTNFFLKINKNVHIQFSFMFFFFFSLVTLSVFFLGGAQSKRLSLIVLTLSLIPLVLIVESCFKDKLLSRILFFLILILPIFLFNNARHLLFTSNV